VQLVALYVFEALPAAQTAQLAPETYEPGAQVPAAAGATSSSANASASVSVSVKRGEAI